MTERIVGSLKHPLDNRLMFSDLINAKKYKIAVEVGVRYGWFSKHLLDNTDIELLYAIDPWDLNKENNDPQGSYSISSRNFAPYKDRVCMIKAKNEHFVNKVYDNSVGFIYLDGLHEHKSVSLDISNWWPKLANGGCLAGHDYCKTDWPGLVRAVDEFVEKEKLDLYVTGIGDNYGETDFGKPSWYVFKG